jgi:glutathione peroxidase
MKYWALILFLGVLVFSLPGRSADSSTRTAYDFEFKTLMGNKPMPLKEYKGKVLLIVNTASHCGFTKQYAALESIYKQYEDQGLVVIGVPSNDFGQQEPGNNEEISTFCNINFGVTFPMTAKEIVKGPDAHPFYLWAKQTLGFGTTPKWNFHKYLVNREGKLIDYFNSTTAPDSSRVKKAIESALAEP